MSFFFFKHAHKSENVHVYVLRGRQIRARQLLERSTNLCISSKAAASLLSLLSTNSNRNSCKGGHSKTCDSRLYQAGNRTTWPRVYREGLTSTTIAINHCCCQGEGAHGLMEKKKILKIHWKMNFSILNGRHLLPAFLIFGFTQPFIFFKTSYFSLF